MGGERTRAESAWAPLSHPVFRALWISSLVSNIGTWMQNVGAAWAMTSLSPSPLMVALVQSATSLPVFIVGLPAGAVADIVDRRRLLDRKSTRLNSSHLGISYAVFCLKKKNTT